MSSAIEQGWKRVIMRTKYGSTSSGVFRNVLDIIRDEVIAAVGVNAVSKTKKFRERDDLIRTNIID